MPAYESEIGLPAGFVGGWRAWQKGYSGPAWILVREGAGGADFAEGESESWETSGVFKDKANREEESRVSVGSTVVGVELDCGFKGFFEVS